MTKRELICVLDTIGADYDEEYVERLLGAVNRKLKTKIKYENFV